MFTIELLAFGVITGLLSIYTFILIRPASLNSLEKLPRNRVLGSALAVVDIIWLAPQAIQIFTPSSFYIVWTISIIALVIGCLFLDYLFARALAGFLILLAHNFLHNSFAAEVNFMGLFSILCIGMGLLGIWMGGLPHIFRDIIRRICDRKKWQVISGSILAVYAIISLTTGISLIL